MSDFNAKPFGDILKNIFYSTLTALFLFRGCRPVNNVPVSMAISNHAILMTIFLRFRVSICGTVFDDSVGLVNAVAIAVAVGSI